MKFGKAIEKIKEGKKVQRKGWNGKGGHSDHCISRMIWGDGECTCKPNSKTDGSSCSRTVRYIPVVKTAEGSMGRFIPESTEKEAIDYLVHRNSQLDIPDQEQWIEKRVTMIVTTSFNASGKNKESV